jgi:DNA-binding MarR family transcriptional regulator
MSAKQEQNLDRVLGFLLHDVSRLMRKSFDDRVASLSLTRSQWWVLAYVYRDQGLTQSALAEILDVGKVTLGGLIDRLEGKGWIERRADPNDRRIKRIFLTESAEPIIDSLRVPAQEVYESSVAGLTESDREKLVDLLQSLKKNLIQDQTTKS